jgi:hypothetical protein
LRRLLLAGGVALVLLGCGGGEEVAPSGEPEGSDPYRKRWEAAVEAKVELRYSDLPGLEGYAGLPPDVRRQLLKVAHLEKCPCGCDHSLAVCYNEVEGCLTVRRELKMWMAWVTARVDELHTPPPEAPPSAEPAADDTPTESEARPDEPAGMESEG